MLVFVLRRLVQAAIVMLTVAFIAFMLFQYVGDPVTNIRVLQDKNRILAIMKDGEFHKAPDLMPHRQRVAI